jgi:A/G-specific adenine glycosylase
LLRWFDRHRRDLPWRRDRDPYRIWVSEVMLQQTRVATVVPFFERFLTAFPTVADLAAADLQVVLRLWEGLGYYRRARNLHRAARQLVDRHGATLPDDPGVWADLPGVGRYMSGAVLSQAFERRLPIVDANVLRVLSRLYGYSEDPRRGPGLRWLWQTAEALLPRTRVGDFNQALMELGALVCTPSQPRCPVCPLAADCAARRRGLQETIPVRPAAAEVVAVREAAVVVRQDERVFLARRPAEGRWADMWEFPHGEVAAGETHEAAVGRLLPELTGLTAELGPELLTIRHGVTRFRITMVCFEAHYRIGDFASRFYTEGRWVALGDLPSYPVSSPQRRLARSLAEGRRQRSLF